MPGRISYCWVDGRYVLTCRDHPHFRVLLDNDGDDMQAAAQKHADMDHLDSGTDPPGSPGPTGGVRMRRER
jgi:hypothetical protein